MNKTYKTYGVIFIAVIILMAILQLNRKTVIDWSKNFSVTEKSPFGLYVFNKEADILFGKKLKRTEKSPYSFYETQYKIKSHNILIIEKEIDEISWEKILNQVSKGSDAIILSENFPQKLQDTLEFTHAGLNYNESSYLYLTDYKLRSDSIVIDKAQDYRAFTKINLKSTEILGDEFYEKQYKDDIESGANFVKINFGKGHFYLHAEPLIVTNYYLLKKTNQNYIEDVFSYLPYRETIWFQNSETQSSQSPMRFILSKPALRYAWYTFLVSILVFIIFNAKRKQRIVPVMEPLKNKSVDFVRSISNLYLQEGDFHEMMAKKRNTF